jgi:hypothetical protein
LIVGEYTVFTIGNPLRNLRIHRFWWRIHKLIVGEYTVFHYSKSLKEIENTQFLGGEYTS